MTVISLYSHYIFTLFLYCCSFCINIYLFY